MLKPENAIRREILLQAERNGDIKLGSVETDEAVNTFYDLLMQKDLHYEYESEFREGAVETEVPCDSCRHYESKSVAMKTGNGIWIGWTYWYGGGKYGEPGAIPWMEEAYYLDCEETRQMVTVRKFTKKETPK